MPNNNLESHGMLISNMYGYFKCLCLINLKPSQSFA